MDTKNKPDCEECQECCEPAWKAWIRPSGFLITLFVFLLIIFLDGNLGNFSVKEAYLPILETVLVTMIIALYGSRGIEKTAKELSKTKQANIPDIYKNKDL